MRSGALAILALAALLPACNVLATTIAVNSTSDAVAADGFCTLREAIQAANTNAAVNECPAGQATPAVDLIDLSAVSGTITLGGTELGVSEDVNINGPAASVLSISGNGVSRVLNILSGTVSISGLTITGGHNYQGAGIYNSGTLTLSQCNISGNSYVNTADLNLSGGTGIANAGTMNVDRCTISNNVVATGSGSGGAGIANGGPATISNSTITGNSASAFIAAYGGGIGNTSQLTLVNCTISGNSASTNGGGFADDRSAGTVTIANTIISGNTGNDGFIQNLSITSGGNNLIGVAFGGFTAAAGDQIGTGTANLGPLQDNGGPTFTMALLAGSTAIDAGNDTLCAAAPVNDVDQRGISRPQDGDGDGTAHCDIGAFEVQAACLFCDDFNAGTISADWTILKPNWTEGGGTLNAAPLRKGVIVAQPGFAGCLNCSAETSVSIAGGIGNRVWLLNHYTDKNNDIEFMLKQETHKVILKQRAGGKIVAKAGAPFALALNTFYMVNIDFDGTQFHVSIDGNPVLTLTPAVTVPSGTVGFEAKNTPAAFDYVAVR